MKRSRNSEFAVPLGNWQKPQPPSLRGTLDVQTEFKSPETTSGPSHVYLNIGIINADPGDTGLSVPQRATFTESRSTPILTDASKYDFSVVRFSTSGLGPLLPLWIPQIQTGQSDPNLTIYRINISRDTPDIAPIAQGSLIWSPVYSGTYAPTPASPFVAQDLTSAYYFAQSYTQFVDIFNRALYGALVNAGLLALTPSCYLTYNGGSLNLNGIFSLNLDSAFNYTENPVSPTLPPISPTYYIQLNPPLANLLYTFNTIYGVPTLRNPASANSFDPQYYTVMPPSIGPTTSGTNSITLFTDTPCTGSGLWNPIDSFVFTSSFLPILPEQGSVPVVIGTSNIGNSGAITGSGFTSIITDYVVPGAPEVSLESTLYAPTAEYRISALSKAVVQVVDVQMFWRYRLSGQLIPVYMPNGSSINMKMMFRRKDWR